MVCYSFLDKSQSPSPSLKFTASHSSFFRGFLGGEGQISDNVFQQKEKKGQQRWLSLPFHEIVATLKEASTTSTI